MLLGLNVPKRLLKVRLLKIWFVRSAKHCSVKFSSLAMPQGLDVFPQILSGCFCPGCVSLCVAGKIALAPTAC